MANRRTAILAAALVLGAVAGLITWRHVGSVEDRANRGARLAQVLVVAHEIEEGTLADRALSAGLIRADKIPEKFRPAGAIVDASSLRGSVAATKLVPGQIVAGGLFVDAVDGSLSFSHRIPEGQVAISIQVDQVHGVANLIAAGDKVNILVVDGEGATPLFQNVDVLTVGSVADQPNADGDDAANSDGGTLGLITFAVPIEAAQKIALAASTATEGGLYLTLSRPDGRTLATSPVSPADLFDGPLSPYA